jgi:hypothetical protein
MKKLDFVKTTAVASVFAATIAASPAFANTTATFTVSDDAVKEIAECNYTQPRFWGDDGNYSITIRKENPIYKCFKYMSLAIKLREAKQSNRSSEQITEIENEMKQYPNTATEDIVCDAKTYVIGVNKEIERQAELERQTEEDERRNEFDKECAKKEVIKRYMNRFPVDTSKMFVRICWSEHPAFYDWDDNELTLSVKAAELIFTELDTKQSDDGYYKTKFEIIVNGEVMYSGRYDLGDEEHGLFNHIRSFANYEFKRTGDSEVYAEKLAFLNAMTDAYADQKEIIVTFADGFKEFVDRFKNSK